MTEVGLSLGDNASGFTFDRTFRTKSPPFLEAPYRFRKHGHLSHDLVRYMHVCEATGTVRRDGETADVQGLGY